MAKADYWRKRFKQMEEAQHDKSLKKAAEIQKQFEQAQAAVDAKLNVWYYRVAKNNNITLAEAKQILNKKELEEFKWTVQDYIKYGKKNAINE